MARAVAALEMPRAGVGMTWGPKAVADDDLACGKLRDPSGHLPSALLEITAVRLRESPARQDSLPGRLCGRRAPRRRRRDAGAARRQPRSRRWQGVYRHDRFHL